MVVEDRIDDCLNRGCHDDTKGPVLVFWPHSVFWWSIMLVVGSDGDAFFIADLLLVCTEESLISRSVA